MAMIEIDTNLMVNDQFVCSIAKLEKLGHEMDHDPNAPVSIIHLVSGAVIQTTQPYEVLKDKILGANYGQA